MTTVLASINAGMRELLNDDPMTVVMGEDLLDPYGGAFKVTKGLQASFPDRVLTTPISEGAIVGLAGGLALRGYKPIVELMFGDFVALAADQIVNHIAKYRLMYADQVSCPVGIRMAVGAGRGYGPTHSQSLEAMFLSIPDILVASVSVFSDPGALLKKCVEMAHPYLFLEHKLLYPAMTPPKVNGTVEQVSSQYGFPTAIVRNFVSGDPDLVVITHGGTTRHIAGLLDRFASEEMLVEFVVPTLINRVDAKLVSQRISHAQSWMVWDETMGSFGWSAEVIASVMAESPVTIPFRRLTTSPGVIPASKELESAILPGADRLFDEAVTLLEAAYKS